HVGVERMVQVELAVPVVEVLLHAHADLVQVALTLHPPCRLAGVLHRRQEQPDEHADQPDHHQQLDEREASVTTARPGGASRGSGVEASITKSWNVILASAAIAG